MVPDRELGKNPGHGCARFVSLLTSWLALAEVTSNGGGLVRVLGTSSLPVKTTSLGCLMVPEIVPLQPNSFSGGC